MTTVRYLSDEELSVLDRLHSQKWQKWRKVISTAIDREQATATISALYQQIGYPSPNVVFLDSPLAIMIATTTVFSDVEAEQQQLHSALLTWRKQSNEQLFQALFSQLRCCSYDVVEDWLGGLSGPLFDRWEWESGLESFPPTRKPMTELDTTHALLSRQSPIAIPDSRYSNSSQVINDWYSQLYDQQKLEQLRSQLISQFDVLPDSACTKIPVRFAIQPIWYPDISAAAVYDFAGSVESHPDPELCTLFANASLHLGFISPFKDICFVSDRPQIKQSVSDNRNAVREPDVQFSDGFSIASFYQSTKLPDFCSTLPLNHWKAQWVTEENDAEVRRILVQEIGCTRLLQELQIEEVIQWLVKERSTEIRRILIQNVGCNQLRELRPDILVRWLVDETSAEVQQFLIREIGYVRLCQELQAEAIDSWREYTLLKLPIFDDCSGAIAVWRDPRQFIDGIKAIHLLKMICPSTQTVYMLRVPPTCRSAREAATWINWGTDPEHFTVET
jgi:hypothetical protein